jgi:hypothetical protein
VGKEGRGGEGGMGRRALKTKGEYCYGWTGNMC